MVRPERLLVPGEHGEEAVAAAPAVDVFVVAAAEKGGGWGDRQVGDPASRDQRYPWM